MRPDKRRSIWQNAFDDPWRKLLSVALGVGLWYYLDARVTTTDEQPIVVVFNADTVKTHATREDPKHYPVGIDYVIVNGKVVIDRGENTGALPGRALRRGRRST